MPDYPGFSGKLLLPLLHPFNGLFSRTTWISRYQKGKTSLDFNEARGDGVLGCSGISWTICKVICTSLLTDNHTNLIFTGRLLFLTPNQQCQSSEATYPGKGAIRAPGRNVPLIRFFILVLYISFASYIVCFATYTFFFFLTYLLPYLSFPLRIDPFPRQMS